MSAKGKRIILLTMALVFLTGLGLFLYPYVNGLLLEREQRQQSHTFLSLLEEEPASGDSTAPTEDDSPLARLKRDAEDYNGQLFSQNQEQLSGPSAYEEPSFLLSDYGLPDEVFAVISIPKLELEMPIYLGASADNLALGAAHMSQTSLPIGGDNTNCVIAGHRGWKGGAYFRELPSLQAGDEVTITNLWETLTYRVSEKKIIYSSESEAILIQPGRDLLTLLTCDYGADGVKYRYLVICERAAGL